MITKRFVAIMIVVGVFAVLFSETVTSQGNSVPGDVAAVAVTGEQIEWQPTVAYDSAILTLSGPDGNRQLEFEQGESIALPLQEKGEAVLAEGQYVYELRLGPVLSEEAQKALAAATTPEEREQVVAELRAAGDLPSEPLVQSGGFAVSAGEVVLVATGDSSATGASDQDSVTEDVVHGDDVIVDGSLCVGIDCVSGEDFAFRTLILKENNTRLIFDDTSADGGYPNNDWQLMANESSLGGQNLFAIVDGNGGARTFVAEAGAPDNALYIHESGRVGLGTSTPVLDIHLKSANTPAIRMQQTNENGWAPYAWDIVGNEANFFIRDVTGGNILPFRLFPGAPSNSLIVQSSGNVGVGEVNPEAQLHVTGPEATFRVENTVGLTPTVTLDLDANGNLTLSGLLTEASDEAMKENFVAVDTAEVLQGIAGLDLTTWNYKADEDDVRHLGPMAQQFHATFGLGADNRHIAGLDVNGVTLAGIQELYGLAQAQEAQIEALEQENEELEERLLELEAAVDALLQAQQEQE
jgi:hypothetical protein